MSRPVLDSRFFSEQSPTREFFQKWKSQGPWNSLVLPLYEWNDILYVGTTAELNPPPLAMNHVLIAADPEALSNLWEKWEKAPEQVEPKPQHQPQVQNSDAPFELQDDSPKSTDESTDEMQTASIKTEAPEGLEGLQSFTSVKAHPSENDDPFSSLESVPTHNQSDQATIEDLGAPAPVQPSPTQSQTHSQGDMDALLRTAVSEFITTATKPSEPIKPSTTPSAPANEKNWITHIFDKTNAHFQKTMVFLTDSHLAKPWKWNEGFEFPTSSVEPIDMNQPSPLRVVFRTHKSFYGAVAPSDVIENFSKRWAKGQPLDHLTVVPILIEDNLIGLVLGQSNTESSDHSQLLILEKVAAEIARMMKANPSSLKAAKSAS